MKAVFASVLVALSLSAPFAHAEDVSSEFSDTLQKAQKAYAERDYTSAGIAKALEAAELYAALSAQVTNPKVQAKYLTAQSEALYFAGNASSARDLKIKYHRAGLDVGDKALAAFGIADVTKVSRDQIKDLKAKLSAEELETLGDALYERGTNLGQWGSANGVAESLGRWPELRANMQVIIDLGLASMHNYGAYRTLGRGYYKIPPLLGGSLKKAEQYLGQAVEKTKASGEVYSVNGFNNTFYAEVLKDADKQDQGKQLLQAFLKADPNTLNPKLVPETKRAQQDAAELLKNW